MTLEVPFKRLEAALAMLVADLQIVSWGEALEAYVYLEKMTERHWDE